jgi:N-acetylgalactosamine kinase
LAQRYPHYVVILAAGKGTRMGSSDRHKVCFLVDGRPVINRAIESYLASGIQQPIVVVGVLASQVMATIAQEHADIIYAYQAEPLGTGNAARQGLRVLQASPTNSDDDLLLVAGDRIIDPQVLEQLYNLYYDDHCDLAMLVVQKTPRSEQGRVVLSVSGDVLGLVEMRDIWQRQAIAKLKQLVLRGETPQSRLALAILLEHMDEKQAAMAFDTLWQRLYDQTREFTPPEWAIMLQDFEDTFAFTRPNLGMSVHTPDEVNASQFVNVSVYLLKASALEYALSHLTRDNAQHEEYLSDIVNALVQGGFKVRALPVSDPRQALGYNNPAELLAVEAYFLSKKRAVNSDGAFDKVFKPISEWLDELTPWPEISSYQGEKSNVRLEFEYIYGRDQRLINERRQAYLELLRYAQTVLPDNPAVAIVHSPGRANILGRHVDHQGGHCNLLAIDREILMVVRPRPDDQVVLHNVLNRDFTDCSFNIGDLVASLPWDDWVSLVNSQPVQELVGSSQGDWSHYVRAAVLRLQKRYNDRPLRGMDLVVHGNIPIAAGLSSSSALVVATAEATTVVNALDIQPAQFVDLCGEGEWFVGTRGGSADHAAMKYGQRGKVTQVSFFPFGITKIVNFPADYRLVICNSGIQARKSAGARDVFNHRVACYRLGLQLIKANYPQYAPLLQHLRDVNTRNLAIPLSWIYRIILSLPECTSPTELLERLSPQVLTPLLASHAPPLAGYPVRGVVLFGLAECERSRKGADLLAEGRITEFGRLMNASHNGDRIVSYDNDSAQPFQYRVSDRYLLGLIEDLESDDQNKIKAAQIEWQPGAYGCSTPEIDYMVDLALRVPGVAGAQLAGAGLGGCMMVLAHHSATSELVEHLTESYYVPRKTPPDISICTPITGSGVLLNPYGRTAS